MTTIAARVHSDGRITMAGDRQTTNAYMQVRTTPKVRRLGDALTGLAGPCRMHQFLRGRPGVGDGEDVHEFAEDLCEWCKDHGLVDPGSRTAGVVWLIGVAGRLYIIDNGFGVTEVSDPYASIGSGQDVAVGALFCGVSASKAVEAASMHDPHTGGGIDVLEVSP